MNLYSFFKSRKGAIDTNSIAAIITAIGFAGILGTLLNQDINDAERQKHFESAQVLVAAAAKMVQAYANSSGSTFSYAGGIPVTSLREASQVNGKTAQWLDADSDKDTSIISLQSLINFDADSPLVKGGADPSQIGTEGLVRAVYNDPNTPGTRIYHPQATAVQVQLMCNKDGDGRDEAPCSTDYDGTNTYMEIADMNVVDIRAKINLVGAANLVLDNFAILGLGDDGETPQVNPAEINGIATYSGTLNSDLSEVSNIKMSYLKMFDAREGGFDVDDIPSSTCSVSDIFRLDVCFLGNTGFFHNGDNLTSIDDNHLANKKLTVSSSAFFDRSSLPTDVGTINVVSPLDVGSVVTDAGTRGAVQTQAVVDPNEPE